MSGNSNRGVSSQISPYRATKFEHLFAGVSSGVVSTLVLHPLDLLKIRFAADDGKFSERPKYTNLTNAFTTICKKEGVRGLYKGVTPNVTGAGTAWGFYFLFYNAIKTEMQEGNSQKQLGPGAHLLAASEAGILSLAMTNPIMVVKTRLCLQYGDVVATAVDPLKTYKGMVDGIYKIFVYEGVRGLYKGFVPGIWGVSHGAIQFMVYEEMKMRYNMCKMRTIDTKLETQEYLFFAALSKLIAAVTTYPYQVVRARLQDAECHYAGAIDCLRKTVKYEGLRGLYKGLTPYLFHVMPNICLVFLIYEKLTNN